MALTEAILHPAQIGLSGLEKAADLHFLFQHRHLHLAESLSNGLPLSCQGSQHMIDIALHMSPNFLEVSFDALHLLLEFSDFLAYSPGKFALEEERACPLTLCAAVKKSAPKARGGRLSVSHEVV